MIIQQETKYHNEDIVCYRAGQTMKKFLTANSCLACEQTEKPGFIVVVVVVDVVVVVFRSSIRLCVH